VFLTVKGLSWRICEISLTLVSEKPVGRRIDGEGKLSEMQIPERLNSLGSTHHQARIKLMIELGQRSLEDPALQELLVNLRRKGPYLRQMGYFAALGARDSEAIFEAARHESSRGLRNLALSGVAICCDDAQVTILLAELGRLQRHKLIVRLYKAKRQSLVRSWVAQLEEPEIELLAYADIPTLKKHRERLLERGTAADWTRLCRQQPAWSAENVLGSDRSWSTKLRLNACLNSLERYRRPEAFSLWKSAVEAGFDYAELPESKLFATYYQQACEWELPPSPLARGPRWQFEQVADQLPYSTCLQLLEAGWLSMRYDWWQKRSLEDRAEFWKNYRWGQVSTDGAIGTVWLDKLPSELRMSEAEAQSLLPCHQFSPTSQVEYFAMLGFDKGYEALKPLMQDADVDFRAAGLKGFTRLGKYEPSRRGEILAVLASRSNEADPVRGAFLEELASLPPSHWQPVHFKPLGEILKALMNAADASRYSMSQAERLVLRLLPYQPAWSSAWLPKLLRHWGQSCLGSWVPFLETPGTVEPLDHELSQLVSEWISTERIYQCQQIFSALGHHLASLPKLADVCVQLCRHPQSEPSRAALQTLMNQAPKHCVKLIPDLLASDPSWVDLRGVAEFLHSYRQDLLDPYLGLDSAIQQGKFASGQTRWVLNFTNGFWRWTPDQQNRYAQQLASLLDDPKRDFQAQKFCVRALANMPAIQPNILQKCAALEETRQALRDAALRALARLDSGQGIPFLLETLEDDRARISIYALRRAILEMPNDKALEQLRSITSNKITVQKEVIRLMGDLPRAAGISSVLDKLTQSGLHRDVRIACLRGLWEHLDLPEVWPPLLEAADSTDESIGKAIATIPEGRHGKQAREHIVELMLKLLTHPSARVRYAVLDRLQGRPVQDPDGKIVQAAIELLSHEVENRLAAAVIFRLFENDPLSWASVLRSQLSNKKALLLLVESLLYRVGNQRQRLAPVINATLETLEEPSLLRLKHRLVAVSSTLEEFLNQIEAVFRPISGDQLESGDAGFALAFHWMEILRSFTYRLTSEQWTAISARWSKHSDERLRRMALEALEFHAQAFGWTEINRASLGEFQNDSSGLVTCKSQFIFPPPSKQPNSPF
jgi:hypothetical protein